MFQNQWKPMLMLYDIDIDIQYRTLFTKAYLKVDLQLILLIIILLYLRFPFGLLQTMILLWTQITPNATSWSVIFCYLINVGPNLHTHVFQLHKMHRPTKCISITNYFFEGSKIQSTSNVFQIRGSNYLYFNYYNTSSRPLQPIISVITFSILSIHIPVLKKQLRSLWIDMRNPKLNPFFCQRFLNKNSTVSYMLID